jgi:hypothetical protein
MSSKIFFSKNNISIFLLVLFVSILILVLILYKTKDKDSETKNKDISEKDINSPNNPPNPPNNPPNPPNNPPNPPNNPNNYNDCFVPEAQSYNCKHLTADDNQSDILRCLPYTGRLNGGKLDAGQCAMLVNGQDDPQCGQTYMKFYNDTGCDDDINNNTNKSGPCPSNYQNVPCNQMDPNAINCYIEAANSRRSYYQNKNTQTNMQNCMNDCEQGFHPYNLPGCETLCQSSCANVLTRPPQR